MNIDKLVNDIYSATKTRVGREGEIMDLKTIRELVEPIVNLTKEAKEKKMYVYIKPISMWIHPDELEKKLSTGWYIYHISLLEMRNPIERLEEMDKEILDRRKQFNKVLREISQYTGIDEMELEITALKKVMIKEKAEDVEQFPIEFHEEDTI